MSAADDAFALLRPWLGWVALGAALACCTAVLVAALREIFGWRRSRRAALESAPDVTAARLWRRELAALAACAAPLALWLAELHAAGEIARRSGWAKIALATSLRLEILSAALRDGLLLSTVAAVAFGASLFARAAKGALVRAAGASAEGPLSRERLRIEERRAWLVPAAAAVALAGAAFFVHAARSLLDVWDNRAAVEKSGPALEALRSALAVALACTASAALLAGFALRRECEQARAIVVLPALAGALLLGWHSRQLALEDAQPIPTDYAFANASLGMLPPATASGIGPDPLEEAILLEVMAEQTLVNGIAATSHRELDSILSNLRGLGAVDRVVLAAQDDLPAAVLRERLATTLSAGVPSASLSLSTTVTRQTPLLGKLVGVKRTAVITSLADSRAACPAGSIPVPLAPADAPLVRELAARVADMRRRGQQVCLVVGEPACEHDHSRCYRRLAAGALVQRRVTLGRDAEVLRFIVDGKAFDALVVEARLIRLHDGAGRSFADITRELEAEGREPLMITNGGMYHPGHRAVGLLVADGEEKRPLERAAGSGNFFLQPNGVFAVVDVYDDTIERDGELVERYRPEVAIVATSEADALGSVAQATQSGPLLLQGGRLHPSVGQRSTRRALRNAVCRGQGGAAALVISNQEVTFHELAAALTQLGCGDGLYLDGTISAMWLPALERRQPTGLFGPMISVSR